MSLPTHFQAHEPRKKHQKINLVWFWTFSNISITCVWCGSCGGVILVRLFLNGGFGTTENMQLNCHLCFVMVSFHRDQGYTTWPNQTEVPCESDLPGYSQMHKDCERKEKNGVLFCPAWPCTVILSPVLKPSGVTVRCISSAQPPIWIWVLINRAVMSCPLCGASVSWSMYSNSV